MKNVILCLTLALILLCGAGCATMSTQAVALPDLNKQIDNPQMGRIYVIRPTMYGGALSMQITDNGKLIGITMGNSYLCWEREPGKVEIAAKAENLSVVSLDVQPAKSYYICQHVGMGWWTARNTLELVSEQKGKEFIKECTPPAYGE